MKTTTVWGAEVRLNNNSAIQDFGVQVRLIQPDDSSIIDALAQTVNQDVVIDAVKELI